MMPERAIVLAAGLGLRMRPLTDAIPKPLVPVAGRPLIDYSLDLVAGAGLTQAVVNASYRGDQLAEYLAARAHPRVTISREETPLETGGGIRQALKLLGDAPFFSINSDVICVSGAEHALKRLAAAWDDARMDALLLVQPSQRAVGFDGPGDFFVEGNTVTRRGERSSAPYIFTGIQLLHPRLFHGCPAQGPFSMNVLYNRDIDASGQLGRVRALVHDGDWLHVGDPAGLAEAEAYFAKAATGT